MNTTAEKTYQPEWEDDILKRKKYAEFLTKYIEGKCAQDKPSLVIALDAAWGFGKTFFVNHWAQDLINEQRSVILFNAWENDSADDPTISFMAQLRNGLTPLRDKLPTKDSIRAKVDKKSKETVTYLRKAIIPAMEVTAKAVLKKATGVAVDEILDAATGANESKIDIDETKDLSKEVFEKALDKFFEKALESHSDRLKSIKHFQTSLEELLKLLATTTDAQGPLYVFIDELDRCRPDYAIRLLEGIKHLFSVMGVTFIVSTNMDQLSKAVSAVYGTNFDGYGYLKRFFDIEFTLPEPSRLSFIELKAKNTVLEKITGCSGIDPYVLSRTEVSRFTNISYIAESMQLDLRSIQTILSTTEAVVLGLPKNTKIADMWLFFVAAARHSHPKLFELISSSNDSATTFHEACAGIITSHYAVPAYDREHQNPISFDLVDLLSFFHTVSKQTRREAINHLNRLSRSEAHQYPNVLLHDLVTFNGHGVRGMHPISEYPMLVNLAGHISREVL